MCIGAADDSHGVEVSRLRLFQQAVQKVAGHGDNKSVAVVVEAGTGAILCRREREAGKSVHVGAARAWAPGA